jgi:hypothetical protein
MQHFFAKLTQNMSANNQKMLKKFQTLCISLPAKIIIGLCLFYLLFSYFAVNPLAKKLLPWYAHNHLASKANVGRVEFDPIRLKATVENFSLTQQDSAPLASFDKLVIDFEASGVFDLAWKFKEISLTNPKGLISISQQGKLNWAELFGKLNTNEKAPPSKNIPSVVIEHINIQHGQLQYIDKNRPTAFEAEISPLDFELDDFSTLPKDRGGYLISAKLADQGGAIKWKGDMGVNPVVSKGTVAIEGIKLAKVLQAVKSARLPFKLNNGLAGANFSYDFALVKDQPKIALSQIKLNLHQLAGTLNNHDELSLLDATVTSPRLDFAMQNKAKLHLQNISLELSELNAKVGSDTLTMKKGLAHSPNFDFNESEENRLALQEVSVNLDTLSTIKANGTAIAVNNLSLTLPSLNVTTSQAAFEHLNISLTELNVNKDKVLLLNLPQLQVNNIALDLNNKHGSIEQVLLAKGQLNAKRNELGQLNWQTAFESPTTKPLNQTIEHEATATDNSPFTIDIAEVALKNWRVSLLDQSFVHPIELNIADVNLGLAVSSPQGEWAIHKLQSQLNTVTVKSNLQNTPIASLAKIQLNQGEIALDKQKLEVQSIIVSGLKTELIKTGNGSLNWQQTLESHIVAKQKDLNTKTATEAPWAVNLKTIALDNSQLHIEDRSLKQSVALDIEKLALEASNASLDLSKPLPIKASFNVKQGGQFSTQGKLTPAPLKADVDLKLAAFSFKPFAPYLNQFALLKLNDGVGNVTGKMHVKQDKVLALTFSGGFSVDKFALVEEDNATQFLAWDKLASDSLEFSLAPNRVQMASLNITNPAGKFIINADKTTNIGHILRGSSTTDGPSGIAPNANPANTPASTQIANTTIGTNTEMAQSVLAGSPSSASNKTTATAQLPIAEKTVDPFPVSIETVRINNASLEFADFSLTPQFGTQIHSLSGVINGVSTNPNATAQVELDGKVDDYGAARIRGALQPFKATNFTDIKLSFVNLEMNRLTPYSGKFAGRRIDTGKLSVDLEYKIKERQLAGENKFIIHKLKLGEKIDSKDAADLPLDLAIAILEDSDGVIDLDLPITGSLDDPKFSYGSIVWKAIRNVLGKIVTSPFRALGKLFGGAGDKLEAITFEAGKATITPPELEKLKAVSTALSKRQGLALGIVPSYNILADSRAIQESVLRRKVAEEMDLKLADDQQAGPIDLSNPKVQKAIDALYDTLMQKGLLKRLASKLEKPKAGHYEEAQEKLTTSIEVKEADLQALAKARGEAIQKQLAAMGVSGERVRLEKTEVAKADSKASAINTRLTLDVKGVKNTAAANDKTGNTKDIPANEQNVTAKPN